MSIPGSAKDRRSVVCRSSRRPITIDHTGQELDIDGVHFVFQYVPDSEAPAELTFFLPRLQAFCGAEIVSHTMHNLYTLRGAKVRDAAKWSGYIDEAIDLFGADTEVVFNSHHWPVWGNAQVLDYLKKQRDMYAYIHDQTLHLASPGLTPRQIAETIKLPQSLEQHVRRSRLLRHAEAQRESGVSVLLRLVRRQSGEPRSAAAAGTRQAVCRRDRRPSKSVGGCTSRVRRGDYRWAATLLDNLVFAQPDDAAAKDLLARIYDQLGYRAESGPWRDFYLTGAQELRHGVRRWQAPVSADCSPACRSSRSSRRWRRRSTAPQRTASTSP